MANFFLKTKRTEGQAKLYTKCKRKGFELWINTGITVDIKEWIKSLRSATALAKYEATDEGRKVHDQKIEVMQTINRLYDEGRINSKDDKDIIEAALINIVNADAIKAEAEVKQSLEDLEVKRKNSIIGFYDYFYTGISDGTIRYGKNNVYREDSIRIWKDFGRMLKAYCQEEMTFDDITKPFADKFSVFLEKRHMMPNTVNKYVGCFRKLCNLASAEGINNNAVSLRVWKERTVKDENTRTDYYLNEEELDGLYNMQLDGVKEQVRDLFFMGYLSCQRFSDYGSLSRTNFKTIQEGVEVIELVQVKTGTHIEVPIVDSRMYDICDKYHYNFPIVERRTINRYIKLILKELSEQVPSLAEKHPITLYTNEIRSEQRYIELCKRVKKGEKLSVDENNHYGKLKRYAEEHNGSPLWERDAQGRVIRPKYETIASHTARRSGLTNLYKTGLLDTREMMSISGHRSEKVFEGYMKVGREEQAVRIATKFKDKIKSKK